ncbi:MAG: hypothetical protein JEZ06_19815 [Anaerolineaceae bacterium]|nr:hypothetical protein [Anaerolineaceae bacterium]
MSKIEQWKINRNIKRYLKESNSKNLAKLTYILRNDTEIQDIVLKDELVDKLIARLKSSQYNIQTYDSGESRGMIDLLGSLGNPKAADLLVNRFVFGMDRDGENLIYAIKKMGKYALPPILESLPKVSLQNVYYPEYVRALKILDIVRDSSAEQPLIDFIQRCVEGNYPRAAEKGAWALVRCGGLKSLK